VAAAVERAGRETLATTFVLGGDVHLNEAPSELAESARPRRDSALREIARRPEIRLRTYDVTVVDGEIEEAL